MRSLVYLITTLAAPVRAAQDYSDNVDCDCYLTNGTVPTYYAEHVFFDFRDLGEYAGVPDPIDNATRSSFSSATSSDYFTSDGWTDTWELQGWNNSNGKGQSLAGDASVLMVNSPSNVYIQKNNDKDASSDTFLTIRTKRLPGFQSAAEFESTSMDYQFLSIRMLARTIGSPGACAAMFTYRAGDKPTDVQEADIEILTRGPRSRIQYTNQPSYGDDGGDVPEATRNVSLPGKLRWDDWLVHRLDWTPERSVWYVAGEEVASIEFQTPRDAAQVIFNVWSDGGSWSGEMEMYDEAYMQVQWIEMVHNTTSTNGEERGGVSRRGLQPGEGLLRRDDDGGCKVVCSIDERDETGTAKVLWVSAGLRMMDTMILSRSAIWAWTCLIMIIINYA